MQNFMPEPTHGPPRMLKQAREATDSEVTNEPKPRRAMPSLLATIQATASAADRFAEREVVADRRRRAPVAANSERCTHCGDRPRRGAAEILPIMRTLSLQDVDAYRVIATPSLLRMDSHRPIAPNVLCSPSGGCVLFGPSSVDISRFLTDEEVQALHDGDMSHDEAMELIKARMAEEAARQLEEGVRRAPEVPGRVGGAIAGAALESLEAIKEQTIGLVMALLRVIGAAIRGSDVPATALDKCRVKALEALTSGDTVTRVEYIVWEKEAASAPGRTGGHGALRFETASGHVFYFDIGDVPNDDPDCNWALSRYRVYDTNIIEETWNGKDTVEALDITSLLADPTHTLLLALYRDCCEETLRTQYPYAYDNNCSGVSADVCEAGGFRSDVDLESLKPPLGWDPGSLWVAFMTLLGDSAKTRILLKRGPQRVAGGISTGTPGHRRFRPSGSGGGYMPE